ncbi:MAG TPA: AGE family epimerase/isomerase [Armatimonadota bacterium]|jgi:N-acylglucosamine 2-epimerase
MTPERIQELVAVYRDGLLLDTIPFWMKNALDPEFGGYITSVDQDGTWLQTDKSVWFQGRFVWMLSTLYNTVEKRPEWLAAAKSGVEFLNAHCFDTDGRMFFSVTREGKPLRKRRYLFSESFAVVALAAYGVASGEEKYKQQALDLFRLMLKYHTTPGLLEPKVNPEVRPGKGLAMPMVLIVTAQELRKAVDDPICTQVINEAIAEIERDFLKPEFKCALELVGPNGEFIDNFDGRTVTPGHSMECGWFIMEEARLRGGDAHLLELGARIVDWSFQIGWDDVHGGVLYFRDCKGLPPTEYWQDMKFWWPHNEAIISNLLAYELTGDAKFARRHKMVHDWAYAHFPDGLHGDWFGYLHRDGTVATRVKGNMWKGPFHLPRMQWYCWKTLERIQARG